MEKHTIELGEVQKTLLLPLWGRAMETRKKKPFLVDNIAVQIVDEINYDFSTIAKNISPLTRASWIARSVFFDKKIEEFLGKYPDGTVLNVGCGFDTTFDRINNGRVHWFDLDLPDVIEIRKQYIKENDRRRFIGESVFGDNWYSEIINKKDVLIMMGGVIYYFNEDEVKTLFDKFISNFEKVELICDYCSTKGIEIANKKVIEQGGMDKRANLVWGIDNIYSIEKWNENMKVKSNMPMFFEYRKKYPIYRRIGMKISDKLKVMSLCSIEMNGKHVD